MTLIAVNHGQLDAAAAQVRSTWARLESQFNELQSLVARLDSGWSGDDHAAYQAYQKKWSDGARDLNQALPEMGKGMVTANDNYRSATQANVRSWQG